MVIIEDEAHAEPQGEFSSIGDAVSELKRRADIPWDEYPNRAPCMSWRTCGRRYEIVEYDNSHLPWTELRRIAALDVSAAGVVWATDAESVDA